MPQSKAHRALAGNRGFMTCATPLPSIGWYRQGADVQACLPLLSIYLGHVNLSGTQAYLTMIPELLAEASQRFERYAAIGDEEQYHD